MRKTTHIIKTFVAAAITSGTTLAQLEPVPGATPATQVALVPGLDIASANNLANGAVGLAAKLLSLNPSDATAARLIQFATAMNPKNENLIYLKVLHSSGQAVDPARIPVRVTHAQYVKYLLDFAKMQKSSYFQLLLYNMVGVLDPTQRSVIVVVQRARDNGLVADFDGCIKRLGNSFPPPPAIPKPLLGAGMAKRLADGATMLAEQRFRAEGRQSRAGLNLIEFAIAVDPPNENALFLKALLTGDHPLQEIVTDVTEDVYFAYLKQVVNEIDNENIRFLLCHLALAKNSADREAIVALQKGKLDGKDIGFQALIDSLNRQTYARSGITSTSPGGPFGGGGKPAKPTLDERLKNAKLRDALVARKWTLHNLKTREEWFFEFIPIGVATDSKGTCKGTRGKYRHSWKRWEFRDAILIIDGYVKFQYDSVRRQWIQADGSKDMFLR